MSRSEAHTYALLGALFFITVGVWTAVFAESARDVLTVAVMDVGQGDAIFIESPTGVQVLIDGGPDSAVLRELPKVMGMFDRSLDAVIGTHPDADHIAGLVDVLERYDVAAFIEPGVPKDTATWRRLQQEVEYEKVAHLVARRGMKIDLGAGAVLDVLYPDKDVSGLSSDKANEGGVVLKLSYGEATMLFMADVSSKVETQLLALDGKVLNVDLLKVGHHGSRTSTSDAFIKAATPAAAIISVGGDNRYGHPTGDVLHTLTKNAVTTLRTDEAGTVIFSSNGGEFVRVK